MSASPNRSATTASAVETSATTISLRADAEDGEGVDVDHLDEDAHQEHPRQRRRRDALRPLPLRRVLVRTLVRKDRHGAEGEEERAEDGVKDRRGVATAPEVGGAEDDQDDHDDEEVQEPSTRREHPDAGEGASTATGSGAQHDGDGCGHSRGQPVERHLDEQVSHRPTLQHSARSTSSDPVPSPRPSPPPRWLLHACLPSPLWFPLAFARSHTWGRRDRGRDHAAECGAMIELYPHGPIILSG